MSGHRAADQSTPGGEQPVERVGDALRAAVERTLAAGSAPAAGTRQRAQDLLDEVTRRSRSAREQVERRGGAAREEVVRRGEQAGGRIAGALSELRPADHDAIGELGERIGSLEAQMRALEALIRAEIGRSNPQVEGEERSSKAHSSGE